MKAKECPDNVIKEAAMNIGAGEVCFLNPDTWELESIHPCMLREVGGMEGRMDGEEILGWTGAVLQSVREQLDKINGWKKHIIIEKPEGHKAFGFMERFVTECIPENDEWRREILRVLGMNKPFARFKHLVEHLSPYRQAWFDFRDQCLEEYVRNEIKWQILDDEEDEEEVIDGQ